MLMRMSTRPKVSSAVLIIFSPPLGSCHTVVTGHGFTAQILYFLNDLIRRGRRSLSFAVPVAAEIVDNHLGAPPGQFQGIGTSQTAAGTGDDRDATVEANLILRDGTVLEDPVIDDQFPVFGIKDSPECPALLRFPDQGLDRLTGIEGLGKTAGQAPHFFRLTGRKTGDQCPAGVTEGAKAVHDRFFKPYHSGKLRISMKLKDIAGKPVQQGLIR